MKISPSIKLSVIKVARLLANETVSGALGTVSTVLAIVSSVFAVQKDIKELFAKKKQ